MTSNHKKPVFLLVGSFALSMIKFRRDLLSEIKAKGFEVHVSLPVPADDDWIAKEFRSMGVIVHESPIARAGMNPFRDMYYFLHLCRLMLKIRPSHMLSYTIKPIIYASLAARFAGVPNRFALVTGRGYAFEENSKRIHVGNLARWLYRLALSRNKLVFFQNSDDEELFRERGLVAADKRTAVVNGSGVGLDEFSVTPFPSKTSFLLIARLLGAKGIREYVVAAGLLRNHGSDVRFSVVGWIDDNPDSISEDELAGWKTEGIVDFLGKQTDVRPAIADSSVYVLPSYREGTPRTVLEAMSMGRPIITTDAPGCREPVIPGENGFLVAVQSTDELAAAMRKFIEDPSLIEKMGARSREIAEDRYDVHKVNDAMLHEMDIK
jgi:glycosyltransferase involved in cell wall biosynthesis